jgi:phosphate transport system substrate-binding protein
MRARNWCAAVLAALFLSGANPLVAVAQDVTLSSRDGALVIEGALQGYDGEFYRVATQYGLLTLDGQGVICDGPGCPDLSAPMANIRVTGAEGPGMALLPGLFTAFAQSRGLEPRDVPADAGFAMDLLDPTDGKLRARIRFVPEGHPASRAALTAGRAEFMVAAHAEPGLGNRVMALDALVPIVAEDNPLPRISTADLARVLAGEIGNWRLLGGPDMPLVVHATEPGSTLDLALTARLGKAVKAGMRHADETTLAEAVARDPYAIAILGQAMTGAARVLPLTDSCGFPLEATALAVKAEDYPLTLPYSLLTPRRRLPLFAREFLEFLPLPEAQAAISAAGLIDRTPERQPLTADGLRLINAIRGASGPDVTLPDLQRLVETMAGADRLSLTFRFQDGSSTLDAHSQANLADLARLLEIGALTDQDIVLAGFSDGTGDGAANLALSRTRAQTIADSLRAALTEELPEGQRLPRVEAFGEALPMACDNTSGGRRINRRVELWLRPATDSPAP